MTDRILQKLQDIYQHKPHRLAHVYGVRDTAISLGLKYNLDISKLEQAALLHDITKYYSHQEHLDIIEKHYPNSTQIIAEYNPKILHAFSAAYIASTEFGITDKEILNAICSHTVGRPEMSMYEKVIFISDYIEPNRTYESCRIVRDIVKESLDKAVYKAIDDSIIFYEKLHAAIPKTAYQARDYYKNIMEEQNGKNTSTN